MLLVKFGLDPRIYSVRILGQILTASFERRSLARASTTLRLVANMRPKVGVRSQALGVVAVVGFLVGGQQAPQGIPAKPSPPSAAPLFLREGWRMPPPSDADGIPATQDAISNPNLELKLYGVSGKDILLAGNRPNSTMPLNLWTGVTTTPSAATLRDRQNFADLSGLAKIRWITRTSGFHTVRPIVKLADGSWLIGDIVSGTWGDFNENEISFSEVRWMALDIERVVTKGRWVEKVDLSRVDEIGFADLMPGSGHGAGGFVNVGRVEVYGRPVKR